MGQWFTYFFENQGFPVEIAGRKTKITPTQLAKKADILIVSVPISQTPKVLGVVAPFMKKEALLSDLASLKVPSLDAMEDATCGTLGMHPLFGPSVTDATGRQIVFCHQKDNKYVTFLKELFEKSGISVIDMSADEHDYQMAYIQALTHALNLVFGKIAFDRKQELAASLHTPIFALQSLVAGRVIQQDLSQLAEMEMYNPYFPTLLIEFLKVGENLLKIVQEKREKDFVNLFTKEQDIAADFSHFATFQTNKILQMAGETPTQLPKAEKPVQIAKNAVVGYLGPEGTYSHQATQSIFPKAGNKKIAINTLHDLFMKVFNNEVDIAIVPAENSTEGTVRETLDYLIDFSLTVSGSFEMPIHHQLLSKEKKLAHITIVVSHPQALAQCRNWLKNNIPHANLTPSASTTENLLHPKPCFAYIASEAGAHKYNLPILSRDIEDNPRNMTRFYVLAKKQVKINGLSSNKTLLFLTVYNRVGILRDILDIFARHNLNLSKLESRPSRDKLWDYHFFVEVEALPSDVGLRHSIKDLGSYCPIIRILGVT